MAYFDDLKKQFDDSMNSHPIPEGYEWEAMKDGIFNKMSDNKRKVKRFPIYFFLLAFALIGTVYLLISNQTVESDPLQTHKTLQPATPDNSINASEALSPSHQKSISDRTDLVEPAAKNDIPTRDNQQITSTDSQQEHESPNDYRSASVKTRPTGQSISAKISDRAMHTIHDDHDMSHIENMPAEDNSLPLPTRSISEVMQHELDKLHMPALNMFPANLTMNVNKLDPIPESKYTAEVSSMYSLSSGLLVWSGRYKGDASYIARRNQASKPLPGFHLHLNRHVPINDGLSLSIGLNYQELFQQFNIQVDTLVSKTFESALLRTDRSAISGRIIQEVYGDTTIMKSQTRTVRHLNAYKSVGMELGLRKKFSLSRKFAAVIGIGSVVGYRTQSSGKTLGSQDQILVFDNGRKPYQTFSMRMTGGIELDYALTSQLSLSTGFSTSKYVTNLSNEPGVQFRPIIYQFSLGMKKNF